LDVNSFNTLISQDSLSAITLNATQDIEVSTAWRVTDSTVPGSDLSLVAGHNIIVDDGAGISAGKNWSLSLNAGPQNVAVNPGSGNDGIYLNGAGFLTAQNGNITLLAANEVQLGWTGASAGLGQINSGTGSVTTSAGGNVSVTATLGDINTGSGAGGYLFNNSATAPYNSVASAQALGGISTGAGGNVTIDAAAGNVVSLPETAIISASNPSVTGDPGSGAFGATAGNVSVTAGGNIYGHYVLTDGTGTITAGQNAGGAAPNENLALSVVNGNWTVDAVNGSIYLDEVRNPNAAFNNTFVTHGRTSQPSAGNQLFTYGAQDSVELDALSGGVFFVEATLPRLVTTAVMPAIFPPSLTVNAGAGGIEMSGDVILFPSQYGDLTVNTFNGGSLVNDPSSTRTTTPELSMSESSATQWSPGAFEDADITAGTPVEFNNPIDLPDPNNPLYVPKAPVNISIAGNMQNVNLRTSAETEVTVLGNLNNSSIVANNLHSYDATKINVPNGQIFDTSPYTFINLPTAIPAIPTQDLPPGAPNTWNELFLLALDPTRIPTTAQIQALGLAPSQVAAYIYSVAHLPIDAIIPTEFVYDTTTQRLGFAGPMSSALLTALGTTGTKFTVLTFGPDGLPLSSGGTYATDSVSWVDPAVIQTIYAESQSASDPNNHLLGYQVAGPGAFNVSANSISLGNSWGILSWGSGLGSSTASSVGFPNLASLTQQGGATVNVTVTGNLDMLTSTIAALGGGDVNVTSLTGSMDLGSPELFGSQQLHPAFGIYTAGAGNVNVTAQQNINIDGSRIATYDGGDITIESYDGNVDAGTGGTTSATVPLPLETGSTAGFYNEQVFGSGILATTVVTPSQFPGAADQPGNIKVLTPNGNITASQGGILQEALNGNVAAGPTITLSAGTAAVGKPGDLDYAPAVIGNVDLGQSGVIGGTVNVSATGNVTGLVISQQNSTVNAEGNFSGTVLAGGNASVAATGSVSGTVIGVTGANVSGNGGDATVLSQNATVNGGSATSTLGTSAGPSATASSAAGAANDETKSAVGTSPNSNDDDPNKKRRQTLLTRLVGRVTVLFK
jgi:hypothetical protein